MSDNTSPYLGPPPPGWTLGQLSRKYETAGRGPGTVSSGKGDAGGVSYGSYQMTSKPNGGTVRHFVNDPWAIAWHSQFGRHVPGSPAFTAVWHHVAGTTPALFQAAQHGYIQRTHYDPLAASTRRQGVDLSHRSAALRDVVWSTSVQHGPRTPVIARAIQASQGNLEDDAALIKAIYAERGRKAANGSLVYFHHNAISVQHGVAKRFVDEEREALSMLAAQRRVAASANVAGAPPFALPGAGVPPRLIP